MAEEEIMIEDDAIALEDTDDSAVVDADVSKIIPFIIVRLCQRPSLTFYTHTIEAMPSPSRRRMT